MLLGRAPPRTHTRDTRGHHTHAGAAQAVSGIFLIGHYYMSAVSFHKMTRLSEEGPTTKLWSYGVARMSY
jgi:hypothetical protein